MVNLYVVFFVNLETGKGGSLSVYLEETMEIFE
jgi:hypothetical protein